MFGWRLIRSKCPGAIATGLALVLLVGSLAGRCALRVSAGEPSGPPPAAPPAEPPLGPQAEHIQRLIEQLGHKDYFVRERAQEELARLGFEAFDALSAATGHEDLEVAARARYLLRRMRVEWTTKDDPPPVKAALQNYESESAANKLAIMRKLAGLADGAGLPALCRLARYEKTSVLSKHAAIQLLGRQFASLPVDPEDPFAEPEPPVPPESPAVPPSKELAEMIQQHLGRSNRSAAQWLLTWARFRTDVPGALDEWNRLVEKESQLLRSSAGETSPEIVAALVRFQVDWLKRAGQAEQTTAALRRLIDLEQGNPQTLAELLTWLLEQKAWKLIDEAAQRFQPQVQGSPILLYTLAQAYLEQGDKPRAEQTAAQALKLNPDKSPHHLRAHLFPVAYQLRQRGLFPWARKEYGHVIALGPADDDLTAIAYYGLSEMLHDQGDDGEAAKVLEKMLDALKDRPAEQEAGRRTLAEVRSRMHYFYACHYQGRNQQDQHRQHLQQALQTDQTDIDVLIACYRLTDQTPQQRQKVLELIKKTAAGLQEEINDEPNNAVTYNQYAWLIGNTEGDLDLALKYSKKSLELTPNNGGFCDTLAHVCFAKGDYENAVKMQTKAAQLEPHSGQIGRQLKVFRAKLQEQKKKP